MCSITEGTCTGRPLNEAECDASHDESRPAGRRETEYSSRPCYADRPTPPVTSDPILLPLPSSSVGGGSLASFVCSHCYGSYLSSLWRRRVAPGAAFR